MVDYPYIIIGTNLKNTQMICRDFVKNNPIKSIKRLGQCQFKIESNGKEYFILHQSYYEQWCKGRTYYLNDQLMHSGYELKEQNNE